MVGEMGACAKSTRAAPGLARRPYRSSHNNPHFPQQHSPSLALSTLIPEELAQDDGRKALQLLPRLTGVPGSELGGGGAD